MKTIIERHKLFVKDFLKIKFTDEHFAKFVKYISLLSDGKNLPIEAKEHPLVGEFLGYREFHIGGDLLVIYKIEDNCLKLIRIGTHSALFKKF
ncbi:MAG: type II toxin-antitoxin system YafQ family toxin [Campylobacterales bacterium]|nr:type II toxin-antitoxin system YafQ family toxin [Campylobacterales bacterium]